MNVAPESLRSTSPRRAPSPPGHLLWGNAAELGRDPLAALTKWQRAHGDVVRLRMGGATVHVVTHPHGVKHVLQDEHTRYGKATRGYAKLELFLGEGLLTSDGELWRRQRRLAQPAFHHQRVAALAGVVVRAAEDTLARWQRLAARREPFDVAGEMMRVTLRVVGEALFGVDLSREATEVQEAIRFIQADAGRRIHGVVDVPLVIPTPNNLRLRRAIGVLDRILLRVIRERRAQLARGESACDLLGMLLEACGDDGMHDRQLRDELMTMLLAGHESTANALTFCWLSLAAHEPVRTRLHAELAAVLGDRRATFDDLTRLPYTTAVIKETLRLYPPAWSMGRAPTTDDEIAGFHIPKGTLVILSPYVTQRHRDFWPEPDVFEPQRFIDDPSRDKLKHGYFPFGAGPRVCIGNQLAMMEAVLVLATLARELRLDLEPGQTVALDPHITLRPRGAVWMSACAA